MTARCALSVALTLACAGITTAAPAPLPRTPRGTTEVVFDAGSAERVRLASAYLASAPFAARVGRSVESLHVTTEGHRVRLRLSGAGDNLAAARSIVRLMTKPHDDVPKEQLERHRVTAEALLEEYTRRFAAMQRLRQRGGPGLNPEDLRATELQMARFLFEAKPLTLVQPPRLVRQR